MELRYYQQEAIDATWDYLNNNDNNPCIVIPTAGGKSLVMGNMANMVVNEFGGRIMILAHVKELLEQNRKACLQANPDLKNKIGVYSAGLKSKDEEHEIIVAGIQSAYKDATKFGRRDLMIVDEAHLIAPKTDGMYTRFLSEAYKVNPCLRVVGLTATPYRMKGGMICKPDGMLNGICYEISVKKLIEDGFLSNLVTKATANPPDFSKVRSVAGEFRKDEVRVIMEDLGVVQHSCEEIVAYTTERKSVLIFCCGIEHSKMVAETIHRISGEEVGEVYGDTPSDMRNYTLQRFRDGNLRYLCNVGVLTTGFDAPGIDCVVLLMPTRSPGKYYQCVGRGFRIAPGKDNCLVLDYGGNIMRHGPVDCMEINEPNQRSGVAPAKTCPECNSVVHLSLKNCPDCGYEFPVVKEDPHYARASDAPIISGEAHDEVMPVRRVEMYVHRKKGFKEGDPRTVRIEYTVQAGFREMEWLCPEHHGYAREKFIAWWEQACVQSEIKPPRVAEHVIDAWKIGLIKEPGEIVVRTLPGNKYGRITHRNFNTEPQVKQRIKQFTQAIRAKRDESFEMEDPFDPVAVHGEIPF